MHCFNGQKIKQTSAISSATGHVPGMRHQMKIAKKNSAQEQLDMSGIKVEGKLQSLAGRDGILNGMLADYYMTKLVNNSCV